MKLKYWAVIILAVIAAAFLAYRSYIYPNQAEGKITDYRSCVKYGGQQGWGDFTASCKSGGDYYYPELKPGVMY